MAFYTGAQRSQMLPHPVRDASGMVLIAEGRVAELLARTVGVGCLEELADTRTAFMRMHWGYSDQDIADLTTYLVRHRHCPPGFTAFLP
jgi:hypothetical protein